MARYPIRFLASFAFWASAALAAPPGFDVDVAARVNPTEVTVGDPLRYEITVTLPPGAPGGTRVDLPAWRGNTGGLDVLEARSESRDADGRRAVIHTLVLAAWETGPDTLPPQRVEVRVPPDTVPLVVYTPPTALRVKSVVSGNGKTGGEPPALADIHDDERMPRALPWAAPLALAALAALVWAIRAARKRRAARRARPAPPPPEPVVTAAERALARLQTLRREESGAGATVNDPGRARAFAFTLSTILREYLAERFGIDALEATTSELLARVDAVPRGLIAPEGRDWLRAFCERIDTVKFADAVPAAPERTRLLEEAAAFVRDTGDGPRAAGAGGAPEHQGPDEPGAPAP